MNISQEELSNILMNNPALRKMNPQLTKDMCAGTLTEEAKKEKEKKEKSPKYLNQKVYVYEDGYASNSSQDHGHGLVKEKFDSLKEFRRYKDLCLMQRAGQISDLRRQVKFVIQEAFTYREEKVNEIAYVADHMYVRNGETVVEDVKGVSKTGKTITSTKDFKLKWKLLKAKNPDLLFEIF